MDSKITLEQIDKITDFQRLILSAYDIREEPNGHRLNLFVLTNVIIQEIFFDEVNFKKSFLDSRFKNPNHLYFFFAVIINFVNPPISRDEVDRKCLKYNIVRNYLERFFRLIKNNFIFFIDIFFRAFDNSSPIDVKKINNMAVFIILHIYNEIAYLRSSYTNPNRIPDFMTDIYDKFLLAPNQNSVGAFLQEAIFAVALNSSSENSLSLAIHLPESGDCLTVFTDNSPSCITELKSNRREAERELSVFLTQGLQCKTGPGQPIILPNSPYFTFCGTYNSNKFSLGNLNRSASNNTSNRSVKFKLLFTSIRVSNRVYQRDESSFLVSITPDVLENLNQILQQCIRNLVTPNPGQRAELTGSQESMSLLTHNFSMTQEAFTQDLPRLESLSVPLTGEVDLKTDKIKVNNGIFRQGDSWYLSPEVSENSKVFRINQQHNSTNWISQNIIRQNNSVAQAATSKKRNSQNEQNNSLAQAATPKKQKSQNGQNEQNLPILRSEIWFQEIKKGNVKSKPNSENFPPLPSKSKQNAGAKKPAKKDSVNKQSKKADAKKLTAKKDAKKTTKTKTAAKKKTTK